MTATVSAKIPDELKEELDREDVNVSDVIRDALEQEITERRREKLRQDATALSDRIGEGVETDEIVDAVRETRQEN
jgi:antitoxin CcdA